MPVRGQVTSVFVEEVLAPENVATVPFVDHLASPITSTLR